MQLVPTANSQPHQIYCDDFRSIGIGIGIDPLLAEVVAH